MVRIFGTFVRTITIIVSVFEGCLIAFTALSLHHIGRGFPELSKFGINFSLPFEVEQQILLSTIVLWFSLHIMGMSERATWQAPALLVSRLLTAVSLGGAGERAREIHDSVANWSRSAAVIHGVWQAQDSERLSVPRELLVRVRGTLSDYVRSRGIDEVVVALDDRRGQFPVTELLDCRLNGVRVTEAATFLERETRKVDLDNLYPSWLIFGEGFHSNRTQAIAKRTFDVSVSALLLFAVWPLMLATALAIKIDSAGPVIYRQRRVGLNGKDFSVLKFRSMRSDAEADGQAQWAKVNDRRITRVGSFIRKTRIDELPQLLCVLKGDMSFVGPRPERPEFVSELAASIPYYSERHRVKPGITGWAQVNYSYGASVDDAREKLKYDLFYTKHHGLLLDLMILVKTVRVVFWGEGAR